MARTPVGFAGTTFPPTLWIARLTFGFAGAIRDRIESPGSRTSESADELIVEDIQAHITKTTPPAMVCSPTGSVGRSRTRNARSEQAHSPAAASAAGADTILTPAPPPSAITDPSTWIEVPDADSDRTSASAAGSGVNAGLRP